MPTGNMADQENTRTPRGKLTVFLGAAPGVGKTINMLESAQERVSGGTDVVIGWVDTHGRPESSAWCSAARQVTAVSAATRGVAAEESREME